jgi:hypothetical protein
MYAGPQLTPRKQSISIKYDIPDLKQGCTIPWYQAVRATTFCTVAPNICGVQIMELGSGAYNF